MKVCKLGELAQSKLAQSNSWRLISLGLDYYPQRYGPSISDTCRQQNGDGNREPVKKHGRARQRHKGSGCQN
jgi:hypothetical protein